MKIHTIGNFQYWYDRSMQCWWGADYDNEGNQISDAEHAYTKQQLLEWRFK